MIKTFVCVLFSALIFLSSTSTVFSATYATYTDLTSFTTAAGTLYAENFNSYSDWQPMAGVNFIPGVNVTSNMSKIDLWPSKFLFAYDDYTRTSGNAYYQINLSSSYSAAGFEIVSWETGEPVSGSVDDGVIELSFADNTTFSLNISQPNSGAPVFFGVVADTPLLHVRWYEPHETSGGNEETALDNIAVGNPVPLPGAIWLLGSGLLGLIGLRKRTSK